MDIYCPRCSEPWDVYELHTAVEEGYAADYDDARSQFYSVGCGVLFGGPPCRENRTLKSEASLVLADVLGGDLDGVAALLEDFEYEGWFG
jgi:hypothetical protein